MVEQRRRGSPESVETEYGGQDVTAVIDHRVVELLEQMLITLKKIEYHLYLGTDAELKDQDV